MCSFLFLVEKKRTKEKTPAGPFDLKIKASLSQAFLHFYFLLGEKALSCCAMRARSHPTRFDFLNGQNLLSWMVAEISIC